MTGKKLMYNIFTNCEHGSMGL